MSCTTRGQLLNILFLQLKREPVRAVYEARANLADHEKIQGLEGASAQYDGGH